MLGILRIHFDSGDLARTVLARTADPAWEMLLSRFRFNDRHMPLAFRPWMQRLRADPERLARMRPGARWLATLAPHGPYFPDFLTPADTGQGFDAGLDALLSTPRTRLRSELRMLARHHRIPDWAAPLANGDVASLHRLGSALTDYHEAVVEPQYDIIQAGVGADRARRADAILASGVEGLMTSLPSLMRWRPPVLEVDYKVDRELHLCGRGIRLVPSYFCYRHPIALVDPELPPVLVYPIDQDLRWPQTAVAGRQRLEALVGRTRTAVLYATHSGATTTQLARLLRVSPASVSRHTGVLRDAGLITTHRHGTAVMHTLTPLGLRLLEHPG